MNQYTRILNTAIAIHANAATIHQQVTTFAEKFSKSIVTTNTSLDALISNFDNAKLENLIDVKHKLHKCNREMNQEFKKPLLQLQKQNVKLTQILTQRIMPFTLSKEIDVTPIQHEAEQIQKLLQDNNSKLEACLIAIKICQTKIAQLDKMLAKIELPDNVIKTAKQIKQATQNIAILNAKILEDDKARGRYETEFKDLGEALAAFKVESSRIGISPTPSP